MLGRPGRGRPKHGGLALQLAPQRLYARLDLRVGRRRSGWHGAAAGRAAAGEQHFARAWTCSRPRKLAARPLATRTAAEAGSFARPRLPHQAQNGRFWSARVGTGVALWGN